MAFTHKEIINLDDPDIGAMAQLMLHTFADPNIVLSEDRIREFLGMDYGGERSFHVLLVKDGDLLVGGTLFSFVPGAGCGFSEYMVVRGGYRGQGVGRMLFDGRREILDRHARNHGLAGARGLFIEVENPERTPQPFLEQERQTAMDAVDRWRVWHRMGFFRTSVPYVQPPLGPGKEAIYYMDLLFAPWDQEALLTRRIPQEWVIRTVTPIWRGWVGPRHEEFLTWMRKQMGTRPVELIPLFNP